MLKILDDSKIKYGDDIIKIITPLGLLGTANYFIELGVPKSIEAIVNDMKNYMLYECNFEREEAKNIDEYPLSSVLANNLDYNFFYGDLGKKQESTSK